MENPAALFKAKVSIYLKLHLEVTKDTHILKIESGCHFFFFFFGARDRIFPVIFFSLAELGI